MNDLDTELFNALMAINEMNKIFSLFAHEGNIFNPQEAPQSLSLTHKNEEVDYECTR